MSCFYIPATRQISVGGSASDAPAIAPKAGSAVTVASTGEVARPTFRDWQIVDPDRFLELFGFLPEAGESR